MASLQETLEKGKKYFEQSKQYASKQWQRTKDLAVEGAKEAADRIVIDEENIPSKSIPRALDKLEKKVKGEK